MLIGFNLKSDPDCAEYVYGWGVWRSFPWDLAGIFPAREQAELIAEKKGADYEIGWGKHRLGSQSFEPV
ncbi:hypothetical protein QLZ26_09630 [Cronobacter universalis]|uniref:hypothetical protein n=1 Tax=Cronobacter universalis TaxID=535744 RepID=UPI0024AEC38D|nr:hypothetical protein [Cronobacter universalis]ELY3758794.1 hypothetical protein [Cronobacter universalis]ELY6246662.1 hypothetical protein [Cronobacter universalis]ELY7392120.1 hypothetical protein [Cronobacter universalis]MDI7660364.1 hypothetical protein [Cronobacter universalis]